VLSAALQTASHRRADAPAVVQQAGVEAAWLLAELARAAAVAVDGEVADADAAAVAGGPAAAATAATGVLGVAAAAAPPHAGVISRSEQRRLQMCRDDGVAVLASLATAGALQAAVAAVAAAAGAADDGGSGGGRAGGSAAAAVIPCVCTPAVRLLGHAASVADVVAVEVAAAQARAAEAAAACTGAHVDDVVVAPPPRPPSLIDVALSAHGGALAPALAALWRRRHRAPASGTGAGGEDDEAPAPPSELQWLASCLVVGSGRDPEVAHAVAAVLS